MAGIIILWAGLAQAQAPQPTNYAYDANGRLVGVTQGQGAGARYRYDAVGNLLEIGTTPAGQLAIYAFAPTRGAVGSPVIIEGQGFSSSPAANSVSFNGIAATVSSATFNQLAVNVPDGAVTGPIGVTVGSQSAVSAMPFVVPLTPRYD
jgi:YD repeat-containing protein